MKDKAKERKIHEICGSVCMACIIRTLKGEKKIPKREEKNTLYTKYAIPSNAIVIRKRSEGKQRKYTHETINKQWKRVVRYIYNSSEAEEPGPLLAKWVDHQCCCKQTDCDTDGHLYHGESNIEYDGVKLA